MVSDVKGVSASKIITAIIEGKDDLPSLRTHIHSRKSYQGKVAEALTVPIIPINVKMIRETIIDFIDKLDQQINWVAAKYQVELVLELLLKKPLLPILVENKPLYTQ